MQQDRFTGAELWMDTDHGKIHDGEGYSSTAIYAAVANAATVNFCFKTPAASTGKYVHWKFVEVLAAANKVRVDVYEAPTNAPANGSDVASINRNRNSAKTSLMQAVKGAMDVNLAGAVTISSEVHTAGVPRSKPAEFVLKPDTWYIYTMTNSTGGATDISLFAFWYEEGAGA